MPDARCLRINMAGAVKALAMWELLRREPDCGVRFQVARHPQSAWRCFWRICHQRCRLLCFSAQSGQRIFPGTAGSLQSRQIPSSFRRWRSSATLAHLSSRFCSSVSLGFGARTGLLRLVARTPSWCSDYRLCERGIWGCQRWLAWGG